MFEYLYVCVFESWVARKSKYNLREHDLSIECERAEEIRAENGNKLVERSPV